MKRFLFLFSLVLFFAPLAKARAGSVFDEGSSSITAASENGVRIVTGSYVIDLIQIMQAGSADSVFHIYDTSVGSSSARTYGMYEGFQGSAGRDFRGEIPVSSGIFISNLGTTPARVRLKYRKKSGFF